MSSPCDRIEPLLSGWLDDELTQQERQRVALHLEGCPACRAVLERLAATRDAVADLPLADTTPANWHEDPPDAVIRATTRLGWLLSLGGGVVLAAPVLWFAFREWLGADGPWWQKLALAAVVVGAGALFTSVLRHRLAVARTDRYNDVEI